jgi:hypothetical protein
MAMRLARWGGGDIPGDNGGFSCTEYAGAFTVFIEASYTSYRRRTIRPSSTEGDWAKVFSEGAERGYRQKQKCADDYYGAEQKAPESKCIVAQRAEAERRLLFVAE